MNDWWILLVKIEGKHWLKQSPNTNSMRGATSSALGDKKHIVWTAEQLRPQKAL